MNVWRRLSFVRRTAATMLLLAAGSCAVVTTPAGLPANGSLYVAMGSSFAAGPGVSVAADAHDRCGRSVDNYAHQLARSRGLQLADVSCSGATTAHILGPWGELKPQLDAVTQETSLITITIGGNDVGYVGGLTWAACGNQPVAGRDPRCKEIRPPTEQAWQSLAMALREIVAEARRRAPTARIILVDYLTVLPPEGTCAELVMPRERAASSRSVAKRLARLTADVARQAQVDLLQASRLSAAHSACSRSPWTAGFPHAGGPRVTVPFHPNLAGMTATARALDQLLQR